MVYKYLLSVHCGFGRVKVKIMFACKCQYQSLFLLFFYGVFTVLYSVWAVAPKLNFWSYLLV